MVTLAEPPATSVYEADLAKARRDIAALEALASNSPRDVEKRVRLAYRQYHLASLTASEEAFDAARGTIAAVLRDFGPKEDICLLKANIEGRFHCLAGVKEALRSSPSLAARAEGRSILADVDFQEGRYQEARVALEALIEKHPTWDNMARLAHWHGRMGNLEEATRWYVAASEELTAKEMRSFAWLELQRGALALSHGQPEEARFHYQRAETAYPGDWRADAHMAGLLAAESRWEEAAALLHSVVKRTSRPDFRQAYGELLLAAGRSRQEAQPWLDAALAAYLKTVERGMVHYYHHLADLHADAGGRPAEAVHWARKDIALRSNFSTQSALAWALLQNGEIEEAVRWIRLALSSGVRDTGIFATAVAIFEAAGDLQSSRRYTQAAEDINPHLYSFHLHL